MGLLPPCLQTVFSVRTPLITRCVILVLCAICFVLACCSHLIPILAETSARHHRPPGRRDPKHQSDVPLRLVPSSKDQQQLGAHTSMEQPLPLLPHGLRNAHHGYSLVAPLLQGPLQVDYAYMSSFHCSLWRNATWQFYHEPHMDAARAALVLAVVLCVANVVLSALLVAVEWSKRRNGYYFFALRQQREALGDGKSLEHDVNDDNEEEEEWSVAEMRNSRYSRHEQRGPRTDAESTAASSARTERTIGVLSSPVPVTSTQAGSPDHTNTDVSNASVTARVSTAREEAEMRLDEPAREDEDDDDEIPIAEARGEDPVTKAQPRPVGLPAEFAPLYKRKHGAHRGGRSGPYGAPSRLPDTFDDLEALVCCLAGEKFLAIGLLCTVTCLCPCLIAVTVVLVLHYAHLSTAYSALMHKMAEDFKTDSFLQQRLTLGAGFYVLLPAMACTLVSLVALATRQLSGVNFGTGCGGRGEYYLDDYYFDKDDVIKRQISGQRQADSTEEPRNGTNSHRDRRCSHSPPDDIVHGVGSGQATEPHATVTTTCPSRQSVRHSRTTLADFAHALVFGSPTAHTPGPATARAGSGNGVHMETTSATLPPHSGWRHGPSRPAVNPMQAYGELLLQPAQLSSPDHWRNHHLAASPSALYERQSQPVSMMSATPSAFSTHADTRTGATRPASVVSGNSQPRYQDLV